MLNFNMIFIIKDSFDKQIQDLSKKYKLIFDDFSEFKEKFDIREWKHLWKWIYKFRVKNSSIPTWKSWWFRIILLVKVELNKVIPFIIYSKNEKENITIKEILVELEKFI